MRMNPPAILKKPASRSGATTPTNNGILCAEDHGEPCPGFSEYTQANGWFI